MSSPTIVRTADAVQRLHDLLHPIIHGGMRLPQWDKPFLTETAGVLAALCWILGHEAGERLERTIQDMEGQLQEAGHYLSKRGQHNGE